MNKRERTGAEVRARLTRAEVPPVEIDAVLEQLADYGLIDDVRYARLFAQDKRALEQWGEARISRDLRRRGVAEDVIAAALAEDGPDGGPGIDGCDAAPRADLARAAAPVSELARASAVLERRFPDGAVTPRDRERAFRLLARKGYTSDVASSALHTWTVSHRGEREG